MLKELRERLLRAHEEMKGLLKVQVDEDRDLTDAEQERFDALNTEVGRVDRLITEAEDSEARDARLAESEARTRGNGLEAEQREQRRGQQSESEDEQKAREARTREAFENWCRYGMAELSSEDRAIMRGLRSPGREIRAPQTTQTGSSGGFTIPEGFRNVLEDALLAFGGARQAGAEILRTSSGNPMMLPTANDTTNKGRLLAENTQVTEQALAFGQAQLDAYKYSSDLVLVPVELMEDSAFSMADYVAKKLGERIGRITNEHMTTGTGTGQPQGFVTGATSGVTAAAAAAVTYDEMVDLQHSIDPAYRNGAVWTFADATFAVLRKLKDGDGRPLWNPAGAGLAGGVPSTFMGHRYVINQDMPAMTTGNKPIAFGDFSKFLIRDVTQYRLVRMNERYADYDQVGFVSFSRHDSVLLDAGTNPLKVITMA